MIPALAILGVGIWVNTTIRKRNHRDVLIFGYLQEVTRQIHKFVTESVDADRLDDCTVALRRLFNEVHHLIDVHDQYASSSPSPRELLTASLLGLKWHLTQSGDPLNEEDREQARQVGHRLRNEVLRIVVRMCEKS